ncbi:MAG: LamG-like jellyroll fold domain-containing protein [Anaerolineales bacterium]
MKKRNQVVIGLIAAIIMLACACPVSGLPFGTEEQPTPGLPVLPPVATIESAPATEAPLQPAANAIFSDDFSSPSAEMETYSGDGGSAGTENGVYVIRSTADLWQWGKSTSTFDNAIIEADVTMIAGPTNNNAGFGIICRLSERDDTSIDGYMFAISGDGYYSIRHIVSGNMNALADWTESSAVNQGNASNHLRVTCNGSDLRLEVNGQEVASVVAPVDGPTSGTMAFAAISFETDQPYAEGHFDNLIVSQP